jgi:hypothetical protein
MRLPEEAAAFFACAESGVVIPQQVVAQQIG